MRKVLFYRCELFACDEHDNFHLSFFETVVYKRALVEDTCLVEAKKYDSRLGFLFNQITSYTSKRVCFILKLHLARIGLAKAGFK